MVDPKQGPHLPKIRKYYSFFATLFFATNAYFAIAELREGKSGADLVSVPLILVLGAICVAVPLWIRARLKQMDAMAAHCQAVSQRHRNV